MSFLLSCISTKHSMLKQHWNQTGQTSQARQAKQATQTKKVHETEQKIECPLTVLGSMQKPDDDQGGLLCLLDDRGNTLNSVELPMPAGMVPTEDGVLIASLGAVHNVTADLAQVRQDVVSIPAFNLLHSMSRSQRGYLVASTGLDAILEFTREGELLWSWWATDHGFTYTPIGELRVVDKTADHRSVKYGTLAQTTHVNSVAELPDGRILASLFHQGMVIAIERESGAWEPLLNGLDHPHAIRILADNYFTVADTARGRALMVHIKDGRGIIEAEVQADTNWLQDCSYDQKRDHWVLVDGKNSRISLRNGLTGEKTIAQFDLNPEWRLYEVLPL